MPKEIVHTMSTCMNQQHTWQTSTTFTVCTVWALYVYILINSPFVTRDPNCEPGARCARCPAKDMHGLMCVSGLLGWMVGCAKLAFLKFCKIGFCDLLGMMRCYQIGLWSVGSRGLCIFVGTSSLRPGGWNGLCIF